MFDESITMSVFVFNAIELCNIQKGNEWLLISYSLTCAVKDSNVPTRPPEHIGGALTTSLLHVVVVDTIG